MVGPGSSWTARLRSQDIDKPTKWASSIVILFLSGKKFDIKIPTCDSRMVMNLAKTMGLTLDICLYQQIKWKNIGIGPGFPTIQN